MWNFKNKRSKQTKQKQTQRRREQTDGCQMEEGFVGWVKKVKGLTNTNRQLHSSHRDVKYFLRKIIIM